MANAINKTNLFPESIEQESLITLRSLQHAAMKLADLNSVPKALSTKALIGLLICQAQRNKRLSHPCVRIHLRVKSRDQASPTYLRLGATNN